MFTGCLEEDFTTNPDHQLTFSKDSVRFDTVFTTIGSSTSRLMVYNSHQKAIRIDEITLMNADKSGFQINVDGMKGNHFEGIEISRNDSLYIFIEVTVAPTTQNEPKRTEDIIQFRYNDSRQQIILEAYGQDAVMWRGKTIDYDTVLSAQKPFLIYDSLKIGHGVHLRLEAGTRLFFHDRAKMLVDGSVSAEGTIGRPVILRGDRTDKLFHNLAYDQMAGQWGGIRIGKESFGNKMTHTHIRGTSFGIVADSSHSDVEKLRLESCILKNSKNELLKATNAAIEADNCEFSNAEGALVHFTGGKYRFTHCTLVNLYPFAVISEASVYLSNHIRRGSGDITSVPLEKADFNNCIIWGKGSVEVNLDEYQKAGNETSFAHRFDHCLIKAKGEDDENFINTIWNEDPHFLESGKTDYLFDFRIDSLSPARNAGNAAYASEFPTDLQGNGRNPDDTDIGAYQWTETAK
ncbi:MAG: hypothetical protein ACRCSQ_03320 [Bacteroidales bacterium]